MPKGSNQKLKLVWLMKILLEKTDENHGMTMSQILKELENHGIAAERKSIYSDFEALHEIGIEVIGQPCGKSYEYYAVGRQFELAELKLLVDAIQSSKFITEKKTTELIRKLESLVSRHEAKQLQRQVFVSGRIKTMNESIYYNVDEIHNAISSNRMIRFQYFQWNTKKETELRKGGAFYQVSPWALSWEDENYYLIGFDAQADKIKHYRVDKMLKISCMDEPRQGAEFFRAFDMAEYTKKSFGMFGGREETVKLEFVNSLAGVVIDRFGKDIMLIPSDGEHFHINIDVAVSGQFFGWLFALGEGVKILGPDHVAAQMREEARKILQKYTDEGV